jgi:hypothetical protein
MKALHLGQLKDMTAAEVRAHMISAFQITKDDLAPYQVLIAFEWDGGYEEANWFLLRKGKRLFENHASHCSCYGFEGQFEPEQTTLKYLCSDKFHFSCGYDAVQQAQDWIKRYL